MENVRIIIELGHLNYLVINYTRLIHEILNFTEAVSIDIHESVIKKFLTLRITG